MRETNLLAELLNLLRYTEYSEDEVLWVGSQDGKFAITWSAFKEIANQDYGDSEVRAVAMDLVIVGKEFWLQREYDDSGRECWSSGTWLNHIPQQKEVVKSFDVVIGETWLTLAELNP